MLTLACYLQGVPRQGGKKDGPMKITRYMITIVLSVLGQGCLTEQDPMPWEEGPSIDPAGVFWQKTGQPCYLYDQLYGPSSQTAISGNQECIDIESESRAVRCYSQADLDGGNGCMPRPGGIMNGVVQDYCCCPPGATCIGLWP